MRQTGYDVMSALVSQEADVLLANLAYGHDTLPSMPNDCSGIARYIQKKLKKN